MMGYTGKVLITTLPDQPEIITRDEVTERIFRLTNATGRKMKLRDAEWKDKWLASSHFVKLDIPLAKVEQPMEPHYPDLIQAKADTPSSLDEPVFIDRNRPHLTRWQNVETITVDGKHRVEAARKLGRTTISAYVGIQAIEHFQNPASTGYHWKKGVIKASVGEATPPFGNQTGNVRLRFMSSDGQPLHLDKLMVKFKADKEYKVPGGMEAKSPPGYSKVAEHFKKTGMPAEQAFKLSWYLYDKGVTPAKAKASK